MKKIIGIFISMLLIFTASSTANIIVLTNNLEQYYFTTYLNDNIIEMMEQIDNNLFLSYLEDFVAFGPKITGTTECYEAGTYLHNQFKSMGLDVRYQNWSYDELHDRNIEAVLQGTNKESEEIYIISAHFDTLSESSGADDDGSGVAAVLSTANIMSQYSFNHTIKFVLFSGEERYTLLSGEEQGLMGSRAYAREAFENNDNVVADLNVDMIGYATSEFESSNICICENTASQWITNFIDNTSQEYHNSINIELNRVGPWEFSDNVAFWEYGYDAIHLVELGNNLNYHTANDTIENMNIDYAVRNSKLILASLAKLANSNIGSIPEKPIITGSEEGEIGEELSFSTSTIDPYNKQLRYLWDWGDDTQSEWLGSFDSGVTVTASHSWDEEGVYPVTVKAKNSNELESDWSQPYIVGIPKKNDGIDQQQNKYGIKGYGAWHGIQLAQSFKPTMNTLTKVSLLLFKYGEPKGLWVSIRSDLNDRDLTTAYISGDDINNEVLGIWYEFNFPEIELIPGQDYYIICSIEGRVNGSAIFWLYGDNNPYSEGRPWYTYNWTWEEFNIPNKNNADFCFKTYHAKSKIKSLNEYNPWLFKLIQRFTFFEKILNQIISIN
jgi:hypothetical protein